jgi:hypothetical protein
MGAIHFQSPIILGEVMKLFTAKQSLWKAKVDRAVSGNEYILEKAFGSFIDLVF